MLHNRVLKIYSDKSGLGQSTPYEIVMSPFWNVGGVSDDPLDPLKRFKEFISQGTNFFRITNVEDSDVIILPNAWTTNSVIAQKFSKLAKSYSKPLAIFFNSDSDEDIPVKNSVIFRTTLYRSTRRPNEFALPAWSEDFLQEYCNDILPIRKKSEIPIVGFCGQESYNTAPHTKHLFKDFLLSILKRPNRIRHELKRLKKREMNTIRKQALDILAKSTLIKNNFLIRDKFWGGAVENGTLEKDKARNVRAEFVRNLIDSDYALVTRGSGNFSYRLYEAMSLGRIPVFVDTDCVLPYENYIDWKKICVWVDETEISKIDEKIVHFHQSLSTEHYEDLQKACRKIWEEWLSPQGFFKNFYRHFHAPQTYKSKNWYLYKLFSNKIGLKILKNFRAKKYPLLGKYYRGLITYDFKLAYNQYEPEVSRVIDKIVEPGWTCIDLGANIGILSLLMAKKVGSFGKVIAIDAFEDNLYKLNKNINLNKFSQQIECVHLAISDGNKPEVDLYAGRNDASAEWNIMGEKVSGEKSKSRLRVPAKSLDQFFPPYSKIDFIKMDIEGAEELALPGMQRILQESKPILLIEFHNDNAWGKNYVLVESKYNLYDLNFKALDSRGPRPYHVLAIPSSKIIPA